jgi:hypothetical protein
MRRTLAALSLAAAVSLVVASAPGIAAGKGKPPRVGAGCRPQVSFVFQGAVTSVAATSFDMDVEAANKHGRSFVGSSATISAASGTRVVRDDAPATLADLSEGDAVHVQVRACKAANRAAMTLVANRVVATSPVVDEIVVEPTP